MFYLLIIVLNGTAGTCCVSFCTFNCIVVAALLTAVVAVYAEAAIAATAKIVPRIATHMDFQNQYQLNPSLFENRLKNHIIDIIKPTILSNIANIYRNRDVPTPIATLIVLVLIIQPHKKKSSIEKSKKHSPNSDKHVYVKVSR